MLRKPNRGTLARSIVLTATIGWVASAAGAEAPFRLVPEMQEPSGLFVQSRSERADLQDDAEARRGLDLLRGRVEGLWPQLREVDWVALSQSHKDSTQGWRLPADTGELSGQVMGYDESSGRWTLELRGPRLPARYDIVHRYLHVYASFEPTTGTFDQLIVTIRGWVLE